MLRISPSQKNPLIKDSTELKYDLRREHYDEIHTWAIKHNFEFPDSLMDHGHVGLSSERLRTISIIPSKNTSLYYLLSQFNPWLDCEMTHKKRLFLKPQAGEISYAVCCYGNATPPFFRNETIIDIANLYLWPLLHSRADEVVACRTFADWRRLFTQTISLAFPNYEYWQSQATDPFISVSDKRRTACILKYMTPARILYLITTSAGFWPYGTAVPSSSPRSKNTNGCGLCCIRPKIKDYTDETKIEWLVGVEFLRKMKRVHMYMSSIASSNVYDAADDDE